MKWLLAALSLLLTLSASSADAAPSRRGRDRLGWAVPDYAKLQTGGYTGLVTVGFGYSAANDVLNWTTDYGYVPSAYAGREVHSVSTALSIRPIEIKTGATSRLVPFYFGAGLLFTFGDGYFVRTPERYRKYDEMYYQPTGARWLAHVGMELDWLPRPRDPSERHGLYVEVRTLDTHLVSYLENPRTIGFHEVLSTAIGYRAAF